MSAPTAAVVLTCPHGVRVETGVQGHFAGGYWRAFLRDTLLACPQCFHTARGYLEEPGE